MSDTMKSFRVQVEETMKRNQVTRTKLAERMGVSKGRVSQLLQADNMTVATVERIAVALGAEAWFELVWNGVPKADQTIEDLEIGLKDERAHVTAMGELLNHLAEAAEDHIDSDRRDGIVGDTRDLSRAIDDVRSAMSNSPAALAALAALAAT